jgi:signal transduction histidine kinase
MARNSGANWSMGPATFSFEIAPPVWQRWWFVGAIALIAFSVSYGLYRYRVGRLLELERTRSRIAMDLHDDIGSSLTRISVMTEVAERQAVGDPKGTARHLSAIGDTAREVIDALGDIVWSVDPKHDNLQNVVSRIVQFGQETCEGRNIAFETDLTDSLEAVRLSPENRRDIFLVFKEAINNVVRHSGAGLVRFRVHPTSRGVLLELSDDGSGIPAAPERAGHGLESMRARGARAGLSFGVKSSGGRGTTVSLEVKTG